MNHTLAAPERGDRILPVSLQLAGVVATAICVFALGAWFGARVAGHAPAVPAGTAAAVPATTVATALAPAAPPATAPAVAAPAVPAAIPPERLTFYDRLSGAAPPAATLPEGQAPASAAATATAPASPREPEPPRADQPPRAAAAPARAPATAPQKATAKATAKPAPKPAAKAAAPARATSPAERIRGLAGPGPHAVQVAAVSDRAAAAATAARLKGQGLEVVTVMAASKGKTLYRVRVGTFPSRQAAGRAAEIFRAELGLQAIAVSE